MPQRADWLPIPPPPWAETSPADCNLAGANLEDAYLGARRLHLSTPRLHLSTRPRERSPPLPPHAARSPPLPPPPAGAAVAPQVGGGVGWRPGGWLPPLRWTGGWLPPLHWTGGWMPPLPRGRAEGCTRNRPRASPRPRHRCTSTWATWASLTPWLGLALGLGLGLGLVPHSNPNPKPPAERRHLLP